MSKTRIRTKHVLNNWYVFGNNICGDVYGEENGRGYYIFHQAPIVWYSPVKNVVYSGTRKNGEIYEMLFYAFNDEDHDSFWSLSKLQDKLDVFLVRDDQLKKNKDMLKNTQ